MPQPGPLPMPDLFDAVIFDCDGVLVDSEPITCRVLSEMLCELGWQISPEETMRTFIGKGIKDEASIIEERTGVPLTPAWITEFRARRDVALDLELVEIVGASAAVRELHEVFQGNIAVASGADRRKVVLQLGKVELLSYFDGRVFSGQEMARSKPHPDVYLAAAAALGADPTRCAIIEDTVTGATAGVAAGATVFGYSPGGPSHSHSDALRAVGVAEVFHDMAGLSALLAGWPGK